MSKNLTDNTYKLLTEHWTRGEAADAYQGYVEINWVGALFIAEQLSDYMGKGFTKLSEWSIKLAEKAIDLLDKIVQKIVKLAGKAVSSLGGVLAGLVNWVATGFEKFPYWSDVEEIVGLIHQVERLHVQIEELVAALGNYFKAYQGVFDAVKTIPEINSTQDVAEITKAMVGGKAEIKDKKKDLEEKKGQLDGKLSEIDKRLNPQDDTTGEGGGSR
ncbi:hypothetical protein [Amycolatopsis aidingensis]|uniref:hypothetical protein n=1 Tax=Amycolatopsis aidingensis TaxID=2842453 RepID=UPI001C0D08C3|nr:hypothetical protein [Amycolatopsis aidingensis]